MINKRKSSNQNQKKENNPIKFFSEIFLLIQNNQYFLAEEKTKALINKNPKDLSCQNLLAIIYASQKKFDNAKTVLKKIINKNPKFVDAYINLGNIYIDLHQLEKSTKCFEAVFKIDQKNIVALQNLSSLYDKLHKYHAASKLHSLLMKTNSNNLEILNNYSVNLINLKKFDDAKKILYQILQQDSKQIDSIINLGIVYKEEKNIEKALEYYFLALKLQPNSSIAYYNLGNIYDDKEEHNNSIDSYKKAIKYNPVYVKAHYNLGCVLDKVGQTSEAILSYKKVLKYDPQNLDAIHNLSRAQLATDDYLNGWKGFELRKENTEAFLNGLGIAKDNIWNGKKFKGTLIVHGEQGIGDELLFSSMFSDLLNYQKDLIVSADDRLISFFERSFPKIKFVNNKKKILFKNNHKHILSGSLGKYFRNSLKDFKSKNKSWLTPNIKNLNENKQLFSKTTKIKIGLSWTTTGINDKKRIISLMDLANVFPENKFDLINLQYGDVEKDIKSLKEKNNRKLIYFNNIDYTNDLETLASLICNCDLVISIGSFTASFSGALGMETWVLVPSISTWCWHSNSKRNDSLWFPNIKLFKQKNLYDWEYVFKLIRTELNLKYN